MIHTHPHPCDNLVLFHKTGEVYMRVTLIVLTAILAGFCVTIGVQALGKGSIYWASLDFGLAAFNVCSCMFNCAAYIKEE